VLLAFFDPFFEMSKLCGISLGLGRIFSILLRSFAFLGIEIDIGEIKIVID
jgi:hypothetical protein